MAAKKKTAKQSAAKVDSSKRRPGRPAKSQATTAAASATKPGQKRRGRPPKADTKPPKAETPATPQKRPGRPPKAESATAPSNPPKPAAQAPGQQPVDEGDGVRRILIELPEVIYERLIATLEAVNKLYGDDEPLMVRQHAGMLVEMGLESWEARQNTEEQPLEDPEYFNALESSLTGRSFAG